MRTGTKWVLLAAIAGCGSASFAGTIQPGDLVIYRVGDGTAALANTGNAVFLDEYTPAGSFVQSIPMPTSNNGNNHSLVASGTATSEGLLTLSTNGQYLLLSGYGPASIPSGSSLAASSASGATGVPRVVGRVDLQGNVDTTTALGDWASGNNPRSVASTDGTNLWIGGAAGGVRYTTLGSTTSTQINTADTPAVVNIRQVNIFGGQLYAGTSSGNAVRIGTIGSGIPTTAGQATTNLPGFPTAGSPYSYFFADINPSIPGLDTLYVAEDTAGGGVIQKYALVSGSWTTDGTITAAAIRGLTGSVDGTNVTLYGTTGGSAAAGGGSIYAFTDSTGFNGTVSGTASTIATAATNEAFRGIALVPVSAPEPATMSLLAPAGLLLLVRRRRQSR